VASREIASFTQRLVKALCGEYLRMNRERKRTGNLNTLERPLSANVGSPPSREAHGDRVPIVAQCSG